MKRILLCFVLFITFLQISFATHNRAGELKIVQLDELTIQVTIITYTKTSSTQADRDSLPLFWGDGTFDNVSRSNGTGIPLENDIKMNEYTTTHTYPGRATYTISVRDKNRVGGIVNIPNSLMLPFYIEATYSFLNPNFQGENNSACLLQPPVDFACVNQPFIHNPNAFDPDGDSIAYELVIPQIDSGLFVPMYQFPNQIIPGPDNIISLDAITGDFVWNSPKSPGEYNIAIRIKEYRNGFLINSFIRDMQILVLNCQDNRPPIIDVVDEICVVAGEQVVLDIKVSDPNLPQRVKLTALGGPFVVTSPAFLSTPNSFMDQPFQSQLIWNTVCENISNEFYSIVLKATDNQFDSTGLSTLRTIRIKVMGPSPENVQTVINEESIKVTWDLPYRCEMVVDDYFKGFSVWRKESSNQFPIDTCISGLNGKGYKKLVSDFLQVENSQYVYEDINVESGKTYCYRILGEFAQTANSGLFFNRVESLPSEEACIQLNRDIPLFTKVSIDTTDSNNGEIHIRWAKPLSEQLDTLVNAGPYQFKLLFSNGLGTSNFIPVPGAEFTSSSFKSFIDTSFIHSNINTESESYTYNVEFYANGQFNSPFTESIPASSVFLNVVGTHRKNIITWDFVTPWDNFDFEVYKLNISGAFDLIARVEEPIYEDLNLTNGTEYCYKILATGTYGFADIENPLFNFSQVGCGIPEDDVPPCPPVITVQNVCEDDNIVVDGQDIVNKVVWRYPPSGCSNFQDIDIFNIYYASTEDAEYQLIGNINGGQGLNEFTHSPEKGISGCYVVTSIDEEGNESEVSNRICVENCPFYALPNAFTPNGDGANDIYGPFPYRFIERIDLKVFNRWGGLVFQTNDPDINWDGSSTNGKVLPDGVYHYVCKVFENAEGEISSPILLKGYIELIAGSN